MTEVLPAYLGRLRPSLEAAPAPEPPPPPAEYARPRAELVETHRPIPVDQLDPDAVRITRRLAENGFQAYLVGGSVRDLLFGLRPKDFDVVTSATPRDIRKLFRNCRIIGRRFRLAHVFFRDKIIEVATFRAQTNGEAEAAENGGALLIRDDNVFGSAEEDALRRDFTVNALFYDVEREVILDYVGGVGDVERRQIRTIGDPRLRMREDPIRMLRAIRLAARMGCTIEAGTWDAIEAYRHEILHSAAPRISEDVLRMFRGGAIAPAMDMLLASGVLEVILPELHEHLSRCFTEDGPEEVEALRASLRIADAKAQAGHLLTTPVQLALLLAPALLSPRGLPAGTAARLPGAEEAAEQLRPIAQRLAISRKDGERLRQVLFTLPKLVPPADRKRRPTGPLVRRAFFPETLELFEIMALATGDFVDEVARWRRRASEAAASAPAPPPRKPAPTPAPKAPEAPRADEAAGPRPPSNRSKRRRRPGGGRRPRPGKGDAPQG